MSLVGADPDATLVERLRAGERSAFVELVERYSGAVMRRARVHVPSSAVAEEVVRETWLLREAIERLPPAQRVVITLRDVYGCESGEVCNALDVSETNQRVLLHRARSRVRADLESYSADD